VRVIVVPADDQLVSDLVILADRASDTLGFLPRQVFQEAARKRTLLAAVQGKKLCGYALFGLPQQYIRLTHLCIAPEFRGRGVARGLITEISRLHPDPLALSFAVAGIIRHITCGHIWDSSLSTRGEVAESSQLSWLFGG
jgi:ribosomal protein S18 acetylase RimI-like enzyme